MTSSLLPRDEIRSVFTETLARDLGRQLAKGRMATPPVTVTSLLLKHSIEVPAGTSDRIDAVLLSDTVYDSEEDQAYRAFCAVLMDLFGTETLATGWIENEWVKIGRRSFVTTTEACPECTVNPLCCANGWSQMAYCLDIAGCGHRIASL